MPGTLRGWLLRFVRDVPIRALDHVLSRLARGFIVLSVYSMSSRLVQQDMPPGRRQEDCQSSYDDDNVIDVPE